MKFCPKYFRLRCHAYQTERLHRVLFGWLALLVSFTSVHAATLVWTNNTGGNWNTAANWSPNQVPGSTDSATLSTAVTVTNSGSASVSNFTFTAGTLGTGTLTVFGTMNWNAGSMNTGSVLNIASNAVLNLTNPATRDLPGATLNNAGTVMWTNGQVRGGNGSIFINSGLWDIRGDDSLSGNIFGGTSVFTNSGTIRKTSAASLTTLTGISVDNSGTVDVQSGTIVFNGGLTGNGNFSGAGAIQLSGTVGVTINGSANWTGGSISGGTLSINGVVNWSGGSVSGSTLNVTSNGTLTASGSTHDMFGTVLNNAGTVLWTGGQIRGGTGTAVINSGLWHLQSDDTFGGNTFGGTSGFTNSGTFRKSVATGLTTLVGLAFQNTGTVDVPSGTVNFNGGLTGSGVYSGAGAIQLSGAVNATINGTANWTGGSISSGSVLNIAGAVNWSGGSISGSALNVTSNATLTLSASTHDMSGTVLSNAGTVLWTGGQIRGGLGTVVNNNGLWNSQSDDSFGGNTFGGSSSFTNSGTFRKSVATGTSTMTALAFQNSGTMDLQTGAVNLSSGLTGAGNYSGNGLLQLNGTVTATVLNGGLNWSSGQMVAGSVLTIGTNGALNILTATAHDLPGATLNNAGTVNWTAGQVRGGLGTVIINSGLWNLLSDDTFAGNTFGGSSSFTNSGTFRKSIATGLTTLTALSFDSSGTIDLQSGTVNFGAGLTGTSTFSGAGFLQMSGNVNATVNGTMNWSSGQMSSGSLLTIPSNSVLNIVSSGPHDLPGSVLNTAGTVVWNDGTIRGGLGTIINNTGFWNVQSNGIFSGNTFGGTSSFTNSGTFRKSGADGTTTFSVASFWNSGTVDLLSGTLSLGAAVQSAGITKLNGGSLSFSQPFQLLGGSLVGTNTITGTITNSALVKPGGDNPGLLTISGSYYQTASGKLDVQIGGTNAGSGYDRLAVSSQAKFDGTLDVTLIDPFVPVASNSFRVVTFSSFTGDFADYEGLVIFTNLALQATYFSTALDLVAATTNSPATAPKIVSQPQGQTIINGQTAAFNVTATGTRPLMYQWQSNQINLATQTNANLTFSNAQPSLSADYRVIVTNNAGSVTSVVATLTVIPVADLVITDVTNPTNAYAAQPAIFTWRSLNQGNQTATAPWNERIALSTNASGVPATTIANITALSNLTSGQSIVRTQSVILPGGFDGTFYVVFTTDTGNQVVEQDNEANNVTISPVPITIRSPDLQPTSMLSPPSAQFGQVLNLSWNVANAGAGPAFASWNDRIYLSAISNSIAGATLLATAGFTNVPVAGGGNVNNNASVTMPLAQNFPPGNYFLVLSVDSGNAVVETNENNNLLTAPISLTFPPLPDLAPINISGPTNVQPGTTVPLSWSITNVGNLSVTSVWSETVLLATNSAGAGAIELGTFAFTNTLAAGSALNRTQSVTVPITSPLGNTWFAVQADSRDDVFESNETNNLATAGTSTFIPAVLTLQLSATQALEGASAITGIVTRNGSRASSLLVTLTNSDPTELSLPAQVTIPIGQASTTFSASPLTDGIVDGPQVVDVTAAAATFASATAQITVLDADHPNLSLAFATNFVREGLTVPVTVSRDSGTNSAVTVLFSSSNPSRLLPPTQVTIPAGAYSNMFAALAVDDLTVQLPADFSLTAIATNYNSASANITVLDDDLPEVVLTLTSTNISENAGPQATMATLQRTPVSAGPIYIELQSSDSGSLLVPALVTIPASQTNVTFPIAAVDNAVLDGSRTVQIQQWVKTSALGARVAEGNSVFVTVNDDEGPALQLSLAKSLVAEGLVPATSGTVSRNGSTNSSLLVNLSSSDTNEAVVPVSVTIPAGATSASFNISTVDDGVSDGNKSVSLTASAGGFASATAPLTVSDVNLPDLVVQSVSAPASADTETYANLGYQLLNQGFSLMTSNTITQKIYLSSDPLIGNDTLVGEYTFTGTLPVGGQIGQTFAIRMPQAAGDYWVVVETDASNQVAEAVENNNTRISNVPVHVNAAYDATVSTTLDSAPANTPVPLTGYAFKPGNIPAPFVQVNIHINVRGTHRVISALSDSLGNFSATWKPLPGEAGFYEIGAAHPGYTNAPVQDTFTLFGMNALPSAPTLTLMGQGSVTGVVQILNAGDVALSSVSAQVLSPPPNLNFNVSLASNAIPGLGTNQLNFTINSTDGLAASGTVVVRLTSAEGATLDVPFAVTVKPLVSQLSVTPSELVRGVKRGVQTVVSFAVTNVGGADSGPITVSLPALSWMSLASVNPLPSLAPGEGVNVSLQLMTATNMPLGSVTGNLLLNAGGNVTAVPFEFRILSEAKGDLRVTAADEFTYYSVGAPPVTNAIATLRDAVSGDVITNGVTDTNGQWFMPQLPEGYYQLEVTADKHSAYKATQFITAGITNDVSAFMSRQTVRYTWTVVPTEIDDSYRIVVQTEFEANVPAPVVTVEPSVIDLAGVTDQTQVDLTLENHGLIAAQDVQLQFDNHPGIKFEPLISNLGTMPAKSTFTVPLVIRRVNDSLRAGATANTVADLGDCFATGREVHHFSCGGVDDIQFTTITFPHAGNCLPSIPIPGFPWIGGGGGGTAIRYIYCVDCGNPPPRYGQFIYAHPGTGGFFDQLLAAVAENIPALAIPNPCDPDCLPKLIPVLKDCVESLVPTDPAEDCIKGSFNCGKDIVLNPSAGTAYNCFKAGLSCAEAVGKSVPGPWKWLPVLECAHGLLTACADSNSFSGFRGSAGSLSFSGPYAGLLGTLQTRVDRLETLGTFQAYFYGDGAWFESEQQDVAGNFMEQFNAATDSGSDGGEMVTAAEEDALLNLPLPSGVNQYTVQHLVERWNRTMTYWQSGIFTLTQVPVGNSTDFLAWDQLNTYGAAVSNAVAQSQADGFASLADGFAAARTELVNVLTEGSGGTCAKVSLQLDQQAVLSRDAFKATLEINNTEGKPLENVYVTLGVFDMNGNDVSALFGIHAPVFANISGTNGSGTLPTDQTGNITWTLVPTVDAAPTNATQYFVSGGLNYVIDGNPVSVPLSPAEITVYPTPRLSLKYFHQRDVFSDDPYTDIIEPSIPYSLAVMVQNHGYGTAHNFRITSAQPQIVDNEKGLLIDFKIIATEVAGQNIQPTLTADFGDIGPGTNAIARWLMTSTLQGLFIDYSASFEHEDELNNPKLSLIDDVSIHEMIHLVQAGGAFEDGQPDFLVNDIPDPHDYPDTLYLSDGSSNHVEIVTNSSVTGVLSPGNLQVQLDAPMPGSWAYLRVPDPANGQYRLIGVVRSDSAVISVDTNAWMTDRTFLGLSKKPLRENILHLLDYNSTGTYTLFYALNPALDTNAPSSAVDALPAESSAGIPLHWSGTDDSGSIAAYDIYVSENGGPFQRWLAGVTGTSAIYQGTLSNSYAFYSAAIDSTGNHEAAPATPDATTTVTKTNSAPQITAITNRTIVEGDILSVNVLATDPDGDGISLQLGTGTPPGVQLNSKNGLLTWATGEGNGPSTNSIAVIARDTGIPQMSATQTFQVIVLESNQPPTLAPIADVTISEGELLSITNVASDLDLPPQQLTFSLGLGAPAGVALNPTNGILTWQPGDLQGGTTNPISVIVTDNATPPLSAAQTFSVVVSDTHPDLILNIGTTQLLAGASSTVPLRLITGADLTNVTLILDTGSGRLTNLVLSTFPPEVLSAQILSTGTNQYQLTFQSQPASRLQGNLGISDLDFGTTPGTNSAVAHLRGVSISGKRASAVAPLTGIVGEGKVFVIGNDPILDGFGNTNRQLSLTLYGLIGKSYALWSLPALNVTNASSLVITTNVNGLKTELPPLPMTNNKEFFRAQLLPDTNSFAPPDSH